MYAERLAELAVQLGFDGWLVNILLSLYFTATHFLYSC